MIEDVVRALSLADSSAKVESIASGLGPDELDQLSAAIVVARAQVAVREELAGRISELALTDELTGVLNRRGFLQQAEVARGVAARAGGTSVLLAIDVVGLAVVTESLGAGEGERLVRDAAALLRRMLRDVDLVGRLREGELVVLMPDCLDAEVARQRILDAAAAWDRAPRIEVSVGAVPMPPGDERSVELVLVEAELLAGA